LPVDSTKDKPKKKCSCGSDKFIAEEDVFDTWMTSSMTPQIAVRWLEQPKDFKNRFPTSLRPQSHDIIRTWAFYTILKSYLHFNDIPWKDISINTFVLDSEGKGMSKSKGNVVWADDILKKYSVDAFRYWVGTASYGSDLFFREQELVMGEKTVTKLWNASKFVIMHLKDFDVIKEPKNLEIVDLAMLSKLNDLVKVCIDKFDKFEYGKASQELYTFFWNVFCDNYLEIVKDRLYNPDKRGQDSRTSAQYVLYKSLLTLLKLFAPIMPFITEEIYHLYFNEIEKEKSIHVSEWPKYNKRLKNGAAEEIWDKFIEILGRVRETKAKYNKSLKHEIILTIDEEDRKSLMPVLDDLKSVCKAKKILFGKFRIVI
jgi:valyl-tRNA synthetase